MKLSEVMLALESGKTIKEMHLPDLFKTIVLISVRGDQYFLTNWSSKTCPEIRKQHLFELNLEYIEEQYENC